MSVLKTIKISAFFLAAALLLPPSAFAASCLNGVSLLNQDEISGFLNKPSTLLEGNGGLALSGRVGALAGSSSNTLNAIVSLTAGASPPQKAAIGAGLASAVKSCSEINPDYANQIQAAVAQTNDVALLTAFAASSGQLATAALNGGAGGAVGGGSIGSLGASGGPNNYKYAGDVVSKISDASRASGSSRSFTFSTGSTGALSASATQ